MVENTKIEWAHHTFNPWEGCTKVGPGCDHCYAENRNARFGGGESVNWGPGAPRRRTSPANWNNPRRWNRQAAEQGVRYRVFCASLADVFDNEVPVEWRRDLFQLIATTPHLDWLLLTKRIGNVTRMVVEIADQPRPASHEGDLMAHAWRNGTPPMNVWLGATVVNQVEADRDIPKLLATPAALRWLSMEPLLGPVDLTFIGCPLCGQSKNHWAPNFTICRACGAEVESPPANRINWVVVGGESGPGARPMHPDWARSLRDQCELCTTPFLFKQWGVWAPGQNFDEEPGADLGEFHQGRNWVDGCICAEGDGAMFQVGKKRAGRLLDGRQHDGFPTSPAGGNHD